MFTKTAERRGDYRPAQSFRDAPARPCRAFDRTFAPGTLLETDLGLRTVEALRPGDRVRTLRGMVQLQGTTRQPPDRSRLHWQVPEGKLGNTTELRLNAGQRIAVQNPACKQLFNQQMVLVPVPTITGYCGIRTITGFSLRCGIALHFAEEEVVLAHTGALLHVPAADSDDSRHRVLSYRESRQLLNLLCDSAHRDPGSAADTDPDAEAEIAPATPVSLREAILAQPL